MRAGQRTNDARAPNMDPRALAKCVPLCCLCARRTRAILGTPSACLAAPLGARPRLLLQGSAWLHWGQTQVQGLRRARGHTGVCVWGCQLLMGGTQVQGLRRAHGHTGVHLRGCQLLMGGAQVQRLRRAHGHTGVCLRGCQLLTGGTQVRCAVAAGLARMPQGPPPSACMPPRPQHACPRPSTPALLALCCGRVGAPGSSDRNHAL